MTMTNRDKVFAQNWIEQMREEFDMYPFSGYVGEPLTYVFECQPHTYVNCLWWSSGAWNRRDDALPLSDLVR